MSFYFPVYLPAFLICAFAMGAVSSDAEPLEPFWYGSVSHLETSKDFFFSQTNIRYQELIWSPQVLLSKGKARRTEFSFIHVNAAYEFKKGDYDWMVRPGLASRNADNSVNSQMLEGEIAVQRTIESTHLTLQGGYVSMAEQLQTPMTVQDFLRGPYFRTSVKQEISKSWRADVYHESYYLTDQNRRSNTGAQAFYALADGRFQLWLGLGADFLTNSESEHSYWSPREQQSYGPRLRLATPLFGRLSFSSNAQMHHQKDISNGEKLGYTVNGKFVYGGDESANVEIEFETIEAQQYGIYWRSQSLKLALLWPI
ncbi:MAG: hypothetical protein AB7N80_06570 [Bdellovibrionales bacterium]